MGSNSMGDIEDIYHSTPNLEFPLDLTSQLEHRTLCLRGLSYLHIFLEMANAQYSWDISKSLLPYFKFYSVYILCLTNKDTCGRGWLRFNNIVKATRLIYNFYWLFLKPKKA